MEFNLYYILENRKPVKMQDVRKWAKWYENFKNRIIKQTQIREVFISTVFLAINHAIFNEEPVLFETMVFGGEHDGYCERYATWEEAEEGHQRACEMVLE